MELAWVGYNAICDVLITNVMLAFCYYTPHIVRDRAKIKLAPITLGTAVDRSKDFDARSLDNDKMSDVCRAQLVTAAQRQRRPALESPRHH